MTRPAVEQSDNDTLNQTPPASQYSNRPIVRQVWKLTRLMFQTIISALLSISLAQLILRIPSIANRLEQIGGTKYDRQIDAFREFMQQSGVKSQDAPIPTDMQSSTTEEHKLAMGQHLRGYLADASTFAWTCQQDAA